MLLFWPPSFVVLTLPRPQVNTPFEGRVAPGGVFVCCSVPSMLHSFRHVEITLRTNWTSGHILCSSPRRWRGETLLPGSWFFRAPGSIQLLYIRDFLVCKTLRRQYCYYLRFEDEKAETQRGEATFPESHSEEESQHLNPAFWHRDRHTSSPPASCFWRPCGALANEEQLCVEEWGHSNEGLLCVEEWGCLGILDCSFWITLGLHTIWKNFMGWGELLLQRCQKLILSLFWIASDIPIWRYFHSSDESVREMGHFGPGIKCPRVLVSQYYCLEIKDYFYTEMNVTLIYRFPVISLLSARFLIWVCLSFSVLVTSPFLPCWKNPSGSKVLLRGGPLFQ